MNNAFDMREILRNNKNEAKKVLVILFAVGVFLMILGDSSWIKKEEKKEIPQSTYKEDYYTETEKQLEEILESVSGAGKVKVMITYSQSSEKIAAQEIRREEQDENGELNSSYESTYVLKDNNEGGTDAIVLTEYMPLPLGVLIVAQGGDNIYVKHALSSAAQALLDVPAHKIEVLKMEG